MPFMLMHTLHIHDRRCILCRARLRSVTLADAGCAISDLTKWGPNARATTAMVAVHGPTLPLRPEVALPRCTPTERSAPVRGDRAEHGRLGRSAHRGVSEGLERPRRQPHAGTAAPLKRRPPRLPRAMSHSCEDARLRIGGWGRPPGSAPSPMDEHRHLVVPAGGKPPRGPDDQSAPAAQCMRRRLANALLPTNAPSSSSALGRSTNQRLRHSATIAIFVSDHEP